MKKILFVLFVLLLTSCSMTIRDPEGWDDYQIYLSGDVLKVKLPYYNYD